MKHVLHTNTQQMYKIIKMTNFIETIFLYYNFNSLSFSRMSIELVCLIYFCLDYRAILT